MRLPVFASVCLAIVPFFTVATARADTIQPTTSPSSAPATQPTRGKAQSLFDPARHLRVDEVRPGMKGYFLTVLSGSKIERFECEVISILHNSFGPSQSVVMIRALGDVMGHYVSIAGCSGSPVYLYDDTGNARLLGAYAYGYDLAKDPIIGVQPIEYMLTLTQPPPGADDTGTRPPATLSSWSLLDAGCIPGLSRFAKQSQMLQDVQEPSHGLAPRLKPMTVPLSVRGLNPSTLDRLGPALRQAGFEPLLAPGGLSGVAPTTQPSTVVRLEPGSVLAAAVLTGDLELTALGTCTEVIDGRAFGFGHPFNGEGITSIPMGAGRVDLVMPLLSNSFKIGGIGGETGAIDLDGTYGVAGQIGAKATTIPISIQVLNNERGLDRTFRFQAALHRTFSPMMIATALQAAVTADQQLPVEYTARYDVKLVFRGGKTVVLNDIATSLGGFEIGGDAAWPVATLMNNPFANVPIDSVEARVVLEPRVRDAEIQQASVTPTVARPGETVRVHIRFKRHKADGFLKTIDVPLPDDLPDGDYTLSLSDAESHLSEMATLEPQRFVARDATELFDTIQSLAQMKHNDRLYVRLSGIGQDVSIGRTALRKLPASKRALLQTSGRPDTAEAAGSIAFAVPMDVAVRGTTQVSFTVRRKLP
jgi:hypothetical protein